MRDFLGLGTHSLAPGQKLFGRPWVKLRLGLIGASVLGVGALVAPRAAQPVPDERVVPLLEERVVSREDANTFRGVQRAASEAARFTVAIPGPIDAPAPLVPDYTAPVLTTARPAGFGVMVSSEGDIITHDSVLDGTPTTRVVTSLGLEEALVAAHDKSSGLTLLRVPAGQGRDAVSVVDQIEPGALVAAVGRLDGQVVVQPAFVSSVTQDGYAVAFVEGSAPPGTPIVDTEGRLVAITAGLDRGRRLAVPASRAIARLTMRAAAGQGHEPSIGVVFQTIEGSLARALGVQGALISEVVDRGPADQAGLVPGDVLVGINRRPVDSPAAALDALSGLAIGSPSLLQIIRRNTIEEHVVVPASAFELTARARRAAPIDLTGLLDAGALWPAEGLAAAGIPPGARVLQINGRPVTSRAQGRRDIARQSPAVVYLWHEGRRFHASVDGPP